MYPLHTAALPRAKIAHCPLSVLHACCSPSMPQSQHATLQKGLHWSKVLTARLNKDVKLVGCTISCESAYMGGIASNEARHNAHVQSYVMATDQVQSFPSYAPMLHLLKHASIYNKKSAPWKFALTLAAAVQ